MVKTNMLTAGGFDDCFSDHPCIYPEDVSEAVLFILATPPNVQVSTDFEVQPT